MKEPMKYKGSEMCLESMKKKMSAKKMNEKPSPKMPLKTDKKK